MAGLPRRNASPFLRAYAPQARIETTHRSTIVPHESSMGEVFAKRGFRTCGVCFLSCNGPGTTLERGFHILSHVHESHVSSIAATKGIGMETTGTETATFRDTDDDRFRGVLPMPETAERVHNDNDR
jgi:hypothetical protein